MRISPRAQKVIDARNDVAGIIFPTCAPEDRLGLVVMHHLA